MKMTAVVSSNIAGIGFDNGELQVEFHNGTIYRYMGVPEDVFEGFKISDSPGRYFYQNVKGKYTAEKVS